MRFRPRAASIDFNFASQNKSEVVLARSPKAWLNDIPVYLPPRELLTIYPGFVPLYETRHVEFEETWRDTCLLLGFPTVKGPRPERVAGVLERLEQQIGKVVLGPGGRFYLRRGQQQHGDAARR